MPAQPVSPVHDLLMIIPINTGIFNAAAKKWIEPVVAPDFRVEVHNLDKGRPAIESRWALAVNAFHVIELVRKLDEGQYAGIFISDFDRTGVDACRELVRIPVIGGFEAQALTAVALAQTFSIITLSQSLVSLDRTHARALGIAENLASVRTLDIRVDHLGDVGCVRERALDASKKAIEDDGAQAIILGCTGMLDVAPWLEIQLAKAGYPVPVLDPNRAAICHLQMLVRCGLTQSATTYPHPPGLKPGRLEELNARSEVRLASALD